MSTLHMDWNGSSGYGQLAEEISSGKNYSVRMPVRYIELCVSHSDREFVDCEKCFKDFAMRLEDVMSIHISDSR